MKIQVTEVFQWNWEAKTRFVVNVGGSRSSKTYSLCQKYILKLLKEKNKIMTITRKTTPALKASVMRDFFTILAEWNLYDPKNHNKSENIYMLNGNLIEFVGMDNPQKKRGSKRNYLWMNEANEFTLEDYRQLVMRTEEDVNIDFNPSDEFHWIYDHVLTRPDVTEIHSTYINNPFLPQSIIDVIEGYKGVDENYWNIYGLGLRGVGEATIYSGWQYCDGLPEIYDREGFGIDWGYTHPTVVTQVREKDGAYYIHQFFYEEKKTNSEFRSEMKGVLPYSSEIIADGEDPNRINEMYYDGWKYIYPANKKVGSVKSGISKIQSIMKNKQFLITKESINLTKEIQSYKWKVDKNGAVSDTEVVKINDDGMDSMRYVLDYMIQPKQATYGKLHSNKPYGF